MKYACLIIMLCASFSFASSQQNSTDKSFYFSIRLKGNHKLSDSVSVAFIKDGLLSSSTSGPGGYSQHALTSANPFVRIWKNLETAARLKVVSVDVSDHVYVFRDQLVLPDDSIVMEVKWENDKWDYSFSGRGAPRFDFTKESEIFRNKIDSVKERLAYQKISPANALSQLEAIHCSYLDLLNQRKHSIGSVAYELIKIDIIGDFRLDKLYLLSTQYVNAIATQKTVAFNKIKKLIDSKSPATAQLRSQSRSWLFYEYAKVKWLLVYERNRNYTETDLVSGSKLFSFRELYKKIKHSYSGKERQYMLTWCLTQQLDMKLYFDGVLPTDYTWCLKDALNVLTMARLRNKIKQKHDREATGAPSYNFAYPDVQGKIIHLSDFKGKLVLLDVWNEECTGCIDFKKALDIYLYDFLKKRSDIVVVSVSTQSDDRKWRKAIEKYSHKEFVELRMNEKEMEVFFDHYDISGYPFVSLIDDEGKIISVTISNVPTLSKVIHETLGEP